MIDHRESADSSDPMLANEPTDSREHDDPIDPIDRTEPIEPIDSAEFFDPIESSEPSDQRDHQERFEAIVRSCTTLSAGPTRPRRRRGPRSGPPTRGRGTT